MVDRIARLRANRDDVLRMLAVAVVRLCREGESPSYDAGHFFASLGEVMAHDGRLGAEAHLYQRCEAALRAAFYMGQYGAQVEWQKLTEDDRRILRQWRN
jgi:hypothetical protein